MEAKKKRVTITGISGFIGAQVCLHFLQHGGFIVRGTVRSKTNEKKIEPLRKAFGELFEQLELAEADLLQEQSIIDACEGADYVVHTASPVPIETPKNPDEVIKPAVEGTLAVMKAAQKHHVKKVVITSSIASIAGGHSDEKLNFTEDDFTDETNKNVDTYAKSKTLAEKAAWEFVANLPEDEKFEVVTINPSVVFGPNLNSAWFAVGDLVKSMMLNKLPGYPSVLIPNVDVRNVAQAHLEAVLRDEANGKRFILCNNCIPMIDCAKILQSKYGDQGYPMKIRGIYKWIAWCGSFFSGQMAQMYKMWNKNYSFDGSRATEILGIEYFSTEQALQDMGDTLIETGYVEDKRPKKAEAK